LNSIIVHETQTGYAQCFKEDAYSSSMGIINLEDIKFSEQVLNGFKDSSLYEKILRNEKFINPTSV
jgi:6-pyruvoyltetrahydropterin/6-carboxytetrahydropterin synthase